MRKIRYGIVGLGNQGSNYELELFDKGVATDATVTAMCDINPNKIEQMKKRTSNKTAVYFTDYRKMLASGLVDAVLVEVPHYLHPQIVTDCLNAGINVICEKPAGVYTRQVREMNEAAKHSGALFGMMFNQRTNCLYRKMREMIAEGKIGSLQRVTWIITDWFRTQYYYDTGSWRATWAGEGGGVLINQCPHQLDLLQWVVGEMPKSIRSFCRMGKWHDIEVEDDVTAYFEYESGATGVFITTTGETPGTNRFEVSGTLGKLLCENDQLKYFRNRTDSQEFSANVSEAFGRPECDTTEVSTDGKNLQHVGIINNFTHTLLGEEKLFVNGADGIDSVEIINAIELSSWLDKKIFLPVDEDLYFKELEKRRKASVFKERDDDRIADTSDSFGSKRK